jgi:YidC/Oxa1 family membrane protein insertase
MELWAFWIDGIRGLLHFLASDLGLGIGLGIFALTLVTRSALLPLTWSVGYRGCIRQKTMARLQPQLKRLKDEFGTDPKQYAEQLQKLYAAQGLSFLDARGLFGLIAQTPIFLGMYQVFRESGNAGRFLWIKDLAKPDLALALIVGLTTAVLMAANPDLPEQMRLLLIVVPAILAVVTALKLGSALAVYFAASNCFSAAQTYCLHALVARRVKSGALVI